MAPAQDGGMEHLRRANAPRLIEWTGERMVPWTDDIQVVYEHLHRYWLAAALAAGRRVLDVGSGEGYGSAILATTAATVQGIDIDEPSIAHARANYGAGNLAFDVGSALDLSTYADDSFDLVVCFEVIEHVTEQEQLLAEIDRVLTLDGLLVCSTPNRLVYSELTGNENPFHEHELSEDEFAALLGRHFGAVRQWDQRTITGSVLHPHGSAPDGAASAEPQTVFVTNEGDWWRRAAAPLPMYLVAVAGRESVPALPEQSVLADVGLTLLRSVERRTATLVREAQEREQVAREEAQTALATQGEQLRGLQERAGHRIDELEQEAAEREIRLAAASSEIAAVRRMVADAEDAHAALEGTNAYLWREIEIAHAKLRRIEESVTWGALERVRSRVAGTDEQRTVLGRGISAALRGARAVSSVRRLPAGPPAPEPEAEAPAPEPVRPLLCFPEHPAPAVSVVIPVHDQPELTLACLEAIHRTTEGVPYEVIVVDDASGPETQALLERIEGIRVIRNRDNLHFLRTANRGATAASGDFIVFLNNDTEPVDGWLRTLLDTARADERIGVVGAKLLLPDEAGVQEAGAIVWRDGSAWHVGRGEHPNEPRLNYLRDVDYASAACLLVRASALREIGGFDERFAPAYYEDVDLCFAIRELGLRVVYQPRAEVVHREGSSHGTDVEQGVKAYQVRNQEVFREKWKAVLDAHHPEREPEREYAHQDRRPGPRVLVIDHQVPAVQEDAGSLRMYYMLEALVRLGCRVTLLPDNHAQREPHTTALQQAGVEVLYGPFQERLVLGELGDGLDLAILSRPTVAWRYLYLLREFNEDARVVYDTVDLHYLREERRALTSNSRAVERVSETFREMESALVRLCDETIAVSAEEASAIEDLVPGTTVRVLPTLHPVAEHAGPATGREGLLFVGGFVHHPNVDAVVHLVRDVLPLVRAELGEIPVWLVGNQPPEEVRALADAPGVEVTGFVEDIEPFFDRARMLVAPLRYGAGVKGKITQSMALGLPVVTTPIGAEGLDARDGEELLVAESAEQLAERIMRVYRDDRLWRTLSQGGLALARRRFAPHVAEDVFAELLELDAAAPATR